MREGSAGRSGKGRLSTESAIRPKGQDSRWEDAIITRYIWSLFSCGATPPQRGRTVRVSLCLPAPSGFSRLPPLWRLLRASSALVVDRAGLEKLFGVSPRTAVRLMNQFGGYQSGKTFLIGREDLIRALEAVQTDEAFAYESRRRQRLVEDLESVRRDLRSRQVKLPVAPEPASGASLPSGMRLVRPGVFEVEFASAEDLLGRLYELVRMAGRGFGGIWNAWSRETSSNCPQLDRASRKPNSAASIPN